ncbi:MAG: fibronectin type III domain-containing protein [Bacteroidetes bacterium]|nr:fibronectin type III domain-containing protein [Bacteroidota bacterium]
MTKLKVGLRGLTVPEKVQQVRQVITDMTGNSNFTTPNPSLATVTAAANDLETAFNAAQIARDAAKTKTVIQNDKEEHLDLLFSQLGGYVQTMSNGNTTIINSAGFDIAITHAHIGEMPKPQNVNATTGDNPGEVDLHWDRIAGCKIYEMEYTSDPAGLTGWLRAGTTTKSSFAVQNLNSGTKFLFRIAAVGTKGQGPWSDSVTKIAP